MDPSEKTPMAFGGNDPDSRCNITVLAYSPAAENGERELQRRLIDTDLGGYANIVNAGGVPMDSLLAHWAAALYMDDRLAEVVRLATIPSWNFANIFTYNLVYQARLNPRPQLFRNFLDTFNVRAGSSGYLRISGSDTPLLTIRITEPGADALPPNMQVWVVRVR